MVEAAGVSPIADGLFWLPYLMGERTPHLDAKARAGWIGLTNRHTRAHLIRAVIEGVCYSQRDCLEIVEGLGATVKSVRASGGGAKSNFWCEILAAILGKPVVRLGTLEGSAYGAALLALVGTGEYASVGELCKVAIREIDTISPGPHTRAYSEAYAVYRTLYPSLKSIFAMIDELTRIGDRETGADSSQLPV
jgi:xylulokinase